MKYVLDSHTHTIASGHAYNTINEMVKAAADKGLELIAITEHAPRMPGTCHEFYFHNLKVLEREKYGIEVLFGTEVNILDTNGQLDLDDKILRNMDVVIASLHNPCIRPGSKEENLAAYLNAMKNPYVNIIGHPDDIRFMVDFEALAAAAKENHVLLELNNSSLIPGGPRVNPDQLDICMLEYCKKYKVPIVVGSDAHTDIHVGRHEQAYELLAKVNFPEELVVNRSVKVFKEYVNRYKHKK